jgi:hypothetical protein
VQATNTGAGYARGVFVDVGEVILIDCEIEAAKQHLVCKFLA